MLVGRVKERKQLEDAYNDSRSHFRFMEEDVSAKHI